MNIALFEPRYAAAFKALNEDWITRLFRLETKDIEVLSDPEGQIIAKGGQIFTALTDEGTPIGCCALVPLAEGDGYELAKMAVTPASQGLGAGRRLMEAAVAWAAEAGAKRLYIETHSSLDAAIGLYRAFGFADMTDHPKGAYDRVDVWMEKRLDAPRPA